MDEIPQVYIYKFFVSALTSQERVQTLDKLLRATIPIQQLDINTSKRLIRIIMHQSIDVKNLRVKMAAHHFHLESVSIDPQTTQHVQSNESHSITEHPRTMCVNIQGMTCHSCELIIERKWKKIEGVHHVEVNAGKGEARLTVHSHILPSINELQNALGEGKYIVHKHHSQKNQTSPDAHNVVPDYRPSMTRLVGLFASVLFIGYLLSRLHLFNVDISFDSQISLGAVFVIGLVAAASSCIAVSGGLLLSSIAKFNERYRSATRVARMTPVFLFVSGRIFSYTFFGGLLGVVGKAIVPSPFITGILILLAAFYMFVMGMEMLHIAPLWLKRCIPKMSKRMSHRIMDQESHEHPLTPFFLGGATFFLPCGFTQALQLYALTTGSFVTAAATLLVFALGTTPSLFALGWASGSLKGKMGKLFFQFSGALVVVLGIWNFRNGLNLIGYPLSFLNGTAQGSSQGNATSDSVIIDQQGVQVVKMNVSPSGYSPNTITVRAGVPVRWEVDGTNAQGCISVLVSRQLGIQKSLQPGLNVFEFTPSEAGKIPFSCSMGMYRGSFTVIPKT